MEGKWFKNKYAFVAYSIKKPGLINIVLFDNQQMVVASDERLTGIFRSWHVINTSHHTFLSCQAKVGASLNASPISVFLPFPLLPSPSFPPHNPTFLKCCHPWISLHCCSIWIRCPATLIQISAEFFLFISSSSVSALAGQLPVPGHWETARKDWTAGFTAC